MDKMLKDTSFPDFLSPFEVSTLKATVPSPRLFSSINDALQDSQRKTPASSIDSG